MAEENKENPPAKEKKLISDLLMKPFNLGWTREVVKRVITHTGTPNCDIYYFNPNKKKLRSLTEVKNNLSEGLTAECFSFKREALGLGPDLETVRDAKVRGKGGGKSKKAIGKKKASGSSKKVFETPTTSTQVEEVKEIGRATKRKRTDENELKLNPESLVTSEKTETANQKTAIEEKKEKELKSEPESKKRRVKSERSNSKENADFVAKLRGKLREETKPTKPVKLPAAKRRKAALKTVMNVKQAKQAKQPKQAKQAKQPKQPKQAKQAKQPKQAKQAKVVPSQQKVNNVRKQAASPKIKLTKAQRDKQAAVKGKKSTTAKVKPAKKPAKKSLTKSDSSKLQDANETDKKSTARDLKSIVKKNIGKYRKLREEQKLGVTRNQPRKSTKKVAATNARRSRSEPISKNKHFYLKPLEKGWRRELVYRSNCAKAGQQADVYYFHPNGKKLRSCREIAENLTHGLSIECFTFRKEPLGCGEPSEVIRNARSFHKR